MKHLRSRFHKNNVVFELSKNAENRRRSKPLQEFLVDKKHANTLKNGKLGVPKQGQ